MGQASREKWIKRAAVYEGILLNGNEKLSKSYLERFSSEKLGKFIKGAKELDKENEIDEQLAESMGSEEVEGDELQD